MKTLSLILLLQLFLFDGAGQSVADRIDSLMKIYYTPNLPGAVIAIHQHQATIFKKGYGLADLQTGMPITPDDNFNIGSLTKQFTAYALLDLCFKGKLSLTDTIGKFFTLPAAVASVKISELLSHSSGIPDHYGFTDTNVVKHATDKDVLKALQKSDTLYFISGTRYRYSNTAYCLLGLLIEKISSMSYPDFLKKNVFGPLGIRDASVFKMDQTVSKRVIGYERGTDGNFIKSDAAESIFFSTEADGGIYISMNNYMKWCQAIENGQLSQTPMIQYAWQPHTPVQPAHGLWYGCGWFCQESKDSLFPKKLYHTGFNGGFRTVVFLIPALDYCISIFSNRSDIDLEDLVSRINQMLHIPDNSFTKSGPLESFIHSWPIFAPCKETSSYSTSFKKNLIAKGMVLN
jgi:CubicO group peptidase (beta-lactamase class C family)